MPRKRLQERALWSHRVYKYWARPIGELHPFVREKSVRMAEAWNQLCPPGNAAIDAIRGLLDSLYLKWRIPDVGRLEGEKPYFRRGWTYALAISVEEVASLQDAAKAEMRAIRQALDRETTAIIEASSLDWEEKGELADRFHTAVGLCIKMRRRLISKRGDAEIFLLHRFTGGGQPVAKLFGFHNTRGWRLGILPVAQEAYANHRRETMRKRLTHGFWGLERGVKLPFETILHRPIPPQAVVKKAVLKATKNHREQLEWAFYVVVEEPPPPSPLIGFPSGQGLVAGLDLGWRKLESYLRVGLLVDSAGRAVELRLPLNEANRDCRRIKCGEGQPYYGMAGLILLDERIGTLIEDTKNFLHMAVRHVLVIPGLAKMRQRGLKVLLQEFKIAWQFPHAIELLEGWLAEDRRLWRIRGALAERLVRRRREIYRNLADWMTRSYRAIIWEEGFSPQALAQQDDQPYPLKLSQKYRHFAALGELRRYLEEAAKKNGCLLLPGEMSRTTIRCAKCGHLVQQTGELYLECACGRRWDQDKNAATNLLGQFPKIVKDLKQKVIFDNFIAQTEAEPLEIPVNLRAQAAHRISIAVECSLD